MSPPSSVGIIWSARFPRVSGDEPKKIDMVTLRCEFSPRERG